MRPSFAVLTVLALLTFSTGARAAGPPGAPPPPAVGVVRAERRPITQTNEFVGRIQAVDRVALVARVTAFLEQRQFTEGTEVKQGELLYRAGAGAVRGRRAGQDGGGGAAPTRSSPTPPSPSTAPSRC